jgi:hypothetical protein
MRDHAPRPREAAGHFLGPSPALDEPNYHMAASLPDSILSICSGGIVAAILVLSS